MGNWNDDLNKLVEAEKLYRIEGPVGLKNLCRLCCFIGYEDQNYRLQLDNGCSVGDLINFLEDNPGAIEAIYNWIGNNFQKEIKDLAWEGDESNEDD